MEPILQKFTSYTIPYGQNIIRMALFGSRARGDEKTYSDYDILILVKKKERSMIDRLYDGVLECQLEFGRDLSLKIYTEEQWEYLRELQTPFYKNVTREGIPLG